MTEKRLNMSLDDIVKQQRKTKKTANGVKKPANGTPKGKLNSKSTKVTQPVQSAKKTAAKQKFKPPKSGTDQSGSFKKTGKKNLNKFKSNSNRQNNNTTPFQNRTSKPQQQFTNARQQNARQNRIKAARAGGQTALQSNKTNTFQSQMKRGKPASLQKQQQNQKQALLKKPAQKNIDPKDIKIRIVNKAASKKPRASTSQSSVPATVVRHVPPKTAIRHAPSADERPVTSGSTLFSRAFREAESTHAAVSRTSEPRSARLEAASSSLSQRFNLLENELGGIRVTRHLQ